MTRFLYSLWFVIYAANVLAEPPQRELPSDPPSIENAPPLSLSLPISDAPAPTLVVPPILQQPLPTVAPRGADALRRYDEEARRRIQQALESGDTALTGDPILDGTINSIRRRGSVVQDWAADQALYSTSPRRLTPQPTDTLSESRYATAEALLRSARLLSQLPNQDAPRQQLIEQLRREALRCLAGGGELMPPVAITQ